MTDETVAAAPAKVPAAPVRDSAYVGELVDSIAPAPTRTTVYLRTFVPYQAYRFARVNLRMLKIIRRSHAD